jgi:hypothetical protein
MVRVRSRVIVYYSDYPPLEELDALVERMRQEQDAKSERRDSRVLQKLRTVEKLLASLKRAVGAQSNHLFSLPLVSSHIRSARIDSAPIISALLVSVVSGIWSHLFSSSLVSSPPLVSNLLGSAPVSSVLLRSYLICSCACRLQHRGEGACISSASV